MDHVFGSTEVPADPQRIVVAGRRGVLSILLDLGLEPVGALDQSSVYDQPFHPLLDDRIEAIEIEPIAPGDSGPNLEQVAALQPDLIIGASVDFADVEPLMSEIAPTVGIAYNFGDPSANVVQVAEVFGLEERGEELVSEFGDAVESARNRVADARTVSLVLPLQDGFRLYRNNHLVGDLIERLGGTVVPTEEELPPEVGTLYNTVSLERADLISSDGAILYVNTGSESADLLAQFLDSPVIENSPAIQNEAFIEIDPQLVFGTAGLTGMRLVLEQVADFLAS
ncbi:MAG: ABC transporter substrate-binding protein [Actinomycetota bacterium]